MTETGNNAEGTATRPISVAELLAKNGSIGSPAPGGRRRRRRGNADAVTVAELTGEIPIITIDEPPTVEETPVIEAKTEEVPEVDEVPVDEAPAEEAEPADAPVEPAEAETVTEAELATEAAPDPTAEPETAAEIPEQREADPEPAVFNPRRHAHTLKKHAPHVPAGGAEGMTFDPLHDDDTHDDDGDPDDDSSLRPRPSYLRSPADALFGGDSVADDVARRGRPSRPGDVDDNDLEATQRVAIAADEPLAALDLTEPEAQTPFMRGVWVVAQSILAVALGAGLFIAFDQLWKWNNIVALALSVLVILGLVVGVRVVRKTEDIASTLIAVAVGAMVTLGPLALLQST